MENVEAGHDPKKAQGGETQLRCRGRKQKGENSKGKRQQFARGVVKPPRTGKGGRRKKRENWMDLIPRGHE